MRPNQKSTSLKVNNNNNNNNTNNNNNRKKSWVKKDVLQVAISGILCGGILAMVFVDPSFSYNNNQKYKRLSEPDDTLPFKPLSEYEPVVVNQNLQVKEVEIEVEGKAVVDQETVSSTKELSRVNKKIPTTTTKQKPAPLVNIDKQTEDTVDNYIKSQLQQQLLPTVTSSTTTTSSKNNNNDNNNKNKNNNKNDLIAVCIAGLVRSLLLPKVYTSLQVNLLDGLAQNSGTPDPHLFLYLDKRVEKSTGVHEQGLKNALNRETLPEDLIDEFVRFLKPKSLKFFNSGEEGLPLDEMNNLDLKLFKKFDQRRYSMFFNRYVVYQEALKYERENLKPKGMQYEWFIMTRPDLAWINKMQAIQHFNRNKISVPDIWMMNINDHFALGPRHLATRMFEMTHIVKHWCIGGPDIGYNIIDKANKKICKKQAMHNFAGSDSDLSMEEIDYAFENKCCMPKFGHEGLSEHIWTRILSDCNPPFEPGGIKTCGHNNDVNGFKDIDQIRLLVTNVRLNGRGAECWRIHSYQGNKGTNPALGGSRPSSTNFLSCQLMFTDCNFRRNPITCPATNELLPSSFVWSKIHLSNDNAICLTHQKEKDIPVYLTPCVELYQGYYYGKQFRDLPEQSFLLHNQRIIIPNIKSDVHLREKEQCLTMQDGQEEVQIKDCQVEDQMQLWDFSVSGEDNNVIKSIADPTKCLTAVNLNNQIQMDIEKYPVWTTGYIENIIKAVPKNGTMLPIRKIQVQNCIIDGEVEKQSFVVKAVLP